MHIENVIFVGAGGHARVVLDAFLMSSSTDSSAVLADDNSSLWGTTLLGRPVIGSIGKVFSPGSHFHVGIGNNSTRRHLMNSLLNKGGKPISVNHPTSQISSFATLLGGCFTAAGSIIAPMCHLGVSVIVNHGAIIDHDCSIGDFSHVAPNATLGGAVHVGSNVLVGAGATILPGVSIGDDSIVGAGAVVHRNVPSRQVVVGIPARPLESVYS